MNRRELTGLGISTPLLGFGTMRLPQDENKVIDQAHVQKMVDLAMEKGVNYFDTAYPYHEGKSEVSVGLALQKYPRDSYLLVDKLPMWEVKEKADMERIFNTQLERCQTDYFDIYLLHSMDASSFAKAVEFGAYDFVRQKQREGKVRFVGFSFHDAPDVLQHIVDTYTWDIAQIQLNYIDWEMQHADLQYQILTDAGIPIIVMEPVRGGFLANLPDAALAPLQEARPDKSAASWALRWVAGHENVKVILSGMGSVEMMADNIDTLGDFVPLDSAEQAALERAVAALEAIHAVPCTGCRYCMDCPFGVDIPRIFAIYNDYKKHQNQFICKTSYLKDTPPEHRADQCKRCGKCMDHCPQHIRIPDQLAEIHQEILAMP
ncbi:aldo/keto reductase [Neobittarella massiliensis]|nr:aldo/keto reductase [Neobittarella massiliensis]